MEKSLRLSTPSNRDTINQTMRNCTHFFLRFLLSTILLFFVVGGVSVPQMKVYAHAGSGPPFVLINGKYAATNRLFLGAPTENGLEIPQDIAPEPYLINTPLSLRIDITQLGIDPSVAQTMEFTWKFTRGDNFSVPVDTEIKGVSVEKTFSAIGSYLISLTSQAPGQDTILLDTIQVNIVPTKNYALPKSGVSIQTSLHTKSSSSFENTSASAVSYLWDFGENKVVKGKKVTKAFNEEYFYTPLYSRSVDKNGFVTDTGIVIVGDKGQLAFSLIDTTADPKSLKVQVQKTNLLLFFTAGSILLLFGIIFLLFRYKKNIIRR